MTPKGANVLPPNITHIYTKPNQIILNIICILQGIDNLVIPMNNFSIENRLNEIAIYLKSKDLNNTGRRILDFVYDFDLNLQIKEKALSLRKAYNETKEIRESRDKLLIWFIQLFEELKLVEKNEQINNQQQTLVCTVTEISKSYNSGSQGFYFEPISLEMFTGKIIGIVGENGNGKTTLLRMLTGDLTTDKGTIVYCFDNQSISNWLEIKKKIAFIPQRLSMWTGSAINNVSFNAAIKGRKSSENIELTDFIIHRLGLTKYKNLTWKQLSSGYRLRFEIAKALVWRPSVMILDEPLANLDIQAQAILLQDLRNLADSIRNPMSIVLSSQQLHEVETVADEIVFLKNGRAVFNGKLRDISKIEDNQIFEVAGSFNYEDINTIFRDWEKLKVEKLSTSLFQVSLSNKYSRHDFLGNLLKNNIEVEYFRDITGSSKKLFHDKY